MRSRLTRVVATFWLGLCAIVAHADRSAPSAPPSWSVVKQAATKALDSQPGYRAGDLITRTEVESVLRQLDRVPWKVPDRQELLARSVEPGSYLAQLGSTPSGKSFLRQVARTPQALDRLDRLSGLPQGQQTIRDLMRSPKGYEMLQYMASPQGAGLGRQLSNAPQGAGFNAPTGRIYTAEALLNRLKALYDASTRPTKTNVSR